MHIRSLILCLSLVTACGFPPSNEPTEDPTEESEDSTSGDNSAGNENGGSSGSEGQTVTPTTVISTYLTTLHSSEISDFKSDDNAISSQAAADGQYLSSAHYNLSKANLLNHVQAFVDEAVVYINSKAPVDTTAVKAIMNDFRAADKAYADSYYRSVNWGMDAGLTSFIAGIQSEIDVIYDLAIGKLP